MHQLSAVRNVLFDLDGTLVDSGKTILDSVFHALEAVGVDPDNGSGVESLIGMPLYDIFTGVYGMPEDLSMQAIDVYREYYHRLNQAGTTVYDGVREGLAGLQDAGYGLYIATVKPTAIAEKVLSDLDLRKHFDGVAGASMGPGRRDKNSIIAWALDRFDLDANVSMMVGDRDQDINGARENGLLSLGVCYGFGHPDEIEEARPDHRVDRFGEIPKLLGGAG
jgi:phosphoglycolate phosphatase